MPNGSKTLANDSLVRQALHFSAKFPEETLPCLSKPSCLP